MDKSFAFQNRTEITFNFLTSDWFVHYTATTKGKECVGRSAAIILKLNGHKKEG